MLKLVCAFNQFKCLPFLFSITERRIVILIICSFAVSLGNFMIVDERFQALCYVFCLLTNLKSY